MATDKNTKGKATHGSSQARTCQNGLMALESRVLFSVAALGSDVPEPVNDAAAAIDASLVPGGSHSVINPDSMRPSDESEGFIKLGDIKGEARNQVPGLIPTQTPGGGSVMVINPDSMFPADEPEGSNPTPHPMPVPELSDSVSKRRLEHGPGLHDSVLDLVGMINPDSMRPTENINATSNRPVSVSPASQDFWIAPSWEASAILHDSVLDSVLVINPDSMRPTANIWTDGTMTNLQSKIGSEHFPPLEMDASVLDSVRGSNWNVPDMDIAPVQSGTEAIPTKPTALNHTKVEIGEPNRLNYEEIR